MSQPAGGRIVLHGHGLQTRDQWGPPDATAPPEVGEVVTVGGMRELDRIVARAA